MKKIVVTTKYVVKHDDLVMAVVLLRKFPRSLTQKGVVDYIAYHGPDNIKKYYTGSYYPAVADHFPQASDK